MSERPEWVRCVGLGVVGSAGQSWCGRPLWRFEWHFIDASHAALNGRDEWRLVACPECVAAITAALKNGAIDGVGA